jgi:anti-sigma factor RsiW
MDHELVARQRMTERYLLGELDADARHEFEEHFFDCPDCAVDVRAGALFVEQRRFCWRMNLDWRA